MDGLGYACAVLLAGLFVRAGAAKLARPAPTAASFVALGIPAPAPMARAVPVLELLVAVALLALPSTGGIGAAALLTVFSLVLARGLRSGVSAPCNCFGAARADPVSQVDLARNIGLALLALAAAFTPAPVVPGPAAVITAGAGFAAGRAGLAWLRRR